MNVTADLWFTKGGFDRFSEIFLRFSAKRYFEGPIMQVELLKIAVSLKYTQYLTTGKVCKRVGLFKICRNNYISEA